MIRTFTRCGVAMLLAATLAAGCSSDDEPATADAPAASDDGGGSATTASDGSWEFTDDIGETIRLDEVPSTIAAQTTAAGGLFEYGITVDGVFGPLRRGDGTPDPSLGLADPDDFESLGEISNDINLEALVAIQPDIIVAAMWDEDTYWGIDDAEVDVVKQIAPIVGIRVDDRPVTEPLARFAELAESLGVDLDEGKPAEHRAEFDRAAADLTAALAAKPDLLVAGMSGTLEEMYVAYPPAWPDLSYFQSLGMNLVEPEDHPTSGGFWETLSWEESGKYPVDLVLVDARTGPIEGLLDLLPAPAKALPPIEAGQYTEWRAAHSYGYGNFAEILDALTVAVEKADPAVAS